MRRLWVVLALGPTLLSGCSDDSDHGRAVTLRPGQPLRVTAREYSFDPARITIRKPDRATTTLTITLRNEGSLVHDLRLKRGGGDVGGTPAFKDGERTVRVPLARGRYELLCTVGDHAELGMKGTVTVQ